MWFESTTLPVTTTREANVVVSAPWLCGAVVSWTTVAMLPPIALVFGLLAKVDAVGPGPPGLPVSPFGPCRPSAAASTASSFLQAVRTYTAPDFFSQSTAAQAGPATSTVATIHPILARIGILLRLSGRSLFEADVTP